MATKFAKTFVLQISKYELHGCNVTLQMKSDFYILLWKGHGWF